jgi:hypothetical protein
MHLVTSGGGTCGHPQEKSDGLWKGMTAEIQFMFNLLINENRYQNPHPKHTEISS